MNSTEAIIAPPDRENTPLTYKDAGVNIDAGDAFVGAIGDDAKRTMRPGADAGLGGFGAVFDLKAAGYKDPVLVAATDGVGTKLELAQETGLHRGLGVDLVAMCANDVLAQGAMPLFFLDYFATGKLETGVAAEIVAGIADGCVESRCALIGGETAEMPGVYPPGGYDLAGFCVGAVERGQHIDPARTKAGDAVIALASDGCHANGFSLIRKVIERAGVALDAPAPFAGDESLGQALLKPTRLYINAVAAIAESLGGMTALHGLAHITGGGLIENPPRAFGDDLALSLDLTTYTLPDVFAWLKAEGAIEALEMARVFNCGIGMLIYVDPGDAAAAINAARNAGYTAWQAGVLTPRETDAVMLNGLETWG
ncbi:MAG: phosphoribosylformylglycinamidine cyclo-ligase [Candidatus Puniceispirillales bacterium]